MATKPTSAQFRAEFSELGTLTDGDVESAILDATELDDTSDRCLLYATAHCGVIRKAESQASPDGGSGLIRSEGEGPQRVGYMNPEGATAAWWGRTSYGRMVLEMRRVSPKRVVSVGVY